MYYNDNIFGGKNEPNHLFESMGIVILFLKNKVTSLGFKNKDT